MRKNKAYDIERLCFKVILSFFNHSLLRPQDLWVSDPLLHNLYFCDTPNVSLRNYLGKLVE